MQLNHVFSWSSMPWDAKNVENHVQFVMRKILKITLPVEGFWTKFYARGRFMKYSMSEYSPKIVTQSTVKIIRHSSFSKCVKNWVKKVCSQSYHLPLSHCWYVKMSPGHMMPEHMLSRQLEYVKDILRKLPEKFGQNRISNSWDRLPLFINIFSFF